MTAYLDCEAMRDDILSLLYDDGELAERSRAREHLAQCVSCRAEYAELRNVRRELSVWTLPEAVLPAPARKMPRWVTTSLAAAAGLVLGVGVSLLARNAMAPDPGASGPLAAAAAPDSRGGESPRFVSYGELQELLQNQESRHQAEIADLRQSLVRVSEPAASQESPLKSVSNVSPAVIEKLLKESEARQAQMVEARLVNLRTQAELQRQYDMAQIAAGLAYIDSRTGADAARTSELMKNLVRVTAKPQDR